MLKTILASLFLLTAANATQASIMVDGDAADWAGETIITDTGVSWLSSVAFSQDSYGVYVLLQTTDALADNSFAFFMDVDQNISTGCQIYNGGWDPAVGAELLLSAWSPWVSVGDHADCGSSSADFPGLYLGAMAGNTIEFGLSWALFHQVYPGANGFNLTGSGSADWTWTNTLHFDFADTTPVPLPATGLLMLIGAFGLHRGARRKV